MRTRMARLILTASLLATVLALPACTGTSAPVETPPADAGGGVTGSEETTGAGGGALDARALILERCTGCHDIARIKETTYDKAGWEASVQRMRDKGAKIDDAEAAAIVDYLAAGGASDL